MLSKVGGHSGRWKGRLLKLPEPRQAREGLHDVQQLLVLELVVLKAAGRPSPSALGWGPLEAPAGKGQAWPPSWGRHNIGSQKELVTCSMVFNRSSWEERPSAGLDAVLIPSLWGVPAWWPQGPSGWTVKASWGGMERPSTLLSGNVWDVPEARVHQGLLPPR